MGTVKVSAEESRTEGMRADRLLVGIAILLTAGLLFTAWHWISFQGEDLGYYVLPWYHHIIEHGRLRSLEASYANYNPPYLYLLSLGTLLNGVLSPTVIIKLVPVPFMVVAAALFRSICLRLGCSNRRGWIAAWIALAAPEVVQNTLHWGQCDIIYTTFVLLFARLMLARRPGWAMASFGIALAFKLQVMFAGPVLLALLIAGEIPWWSVPVALAAYVLMMVPAALAGRPWSELLLIYRQQYGYYQSLSMFAPNPYQLVLHWTTNATEQTSAVVRAIGRAGLAIGAAGSLALAAWLWRRRPILGVRLIAALAFCLVMVPYLLPKMHERYFFAGNMMVLLLAMLRPRWGVPALLVQVAAMITYARYFQDVNRGVVYFSVPVALVTVALVLLGRYLVEAFREPVGVAEAEGL